MNDSPSHPSHPSRSRPRIILVALVCAGVILIAAGFQKHFPMGSPWRIAMAVVQALATATVIVRSDEMQQRIMLEGLALGFAGAAVLASTYGFLEHAGLPRLDWGLWMWPVMVVLWAIGLVIAKRRYR